MELTIDTFEFGKRPEVTLPSPEFFKVMKEDGIRKMVSDHYDLLRQSNVKELFPESDEQFEMARTHSADFFVQICGGHPYYNENRGKPLLVKRHQPFKITPEARLTWLKCYQIVLSKLDIPEEIKQSFWTYLNYFSNWMVNTNQ